MRIKWSNVHFNSRSYFRYLGTALGCNMRYVFSIIALGVFWAVGLLLCFRVTVPSDQVDVRIKGGAVLGAVFDLYTVLALSFH